MLKGVNKQVLEIAQTENGFFEKAIFFVKPEYSGMSEGKLKESAQMELAKAGKPPLSAKEKRVGLCRALTYIGCLVSGVVTGFLFSSLL